ncbi:MAG TPA: hypothetical protein VEL75_19070 [Candidatus Methylomirabilis sp.]|nr:hypothetical protein [Candidatus Methylomirabilis sp.]
MSAASLGPVETEPAEVTAARALDSELGEKAGAGGRDLRRFVVEHDVPAGDERIGEIDAEPAGQVVVADPGRAERAGSRRQRAESRSPLEGDGDDPVDHLNHRRRGQPEIAPSSTADRREHARLGQFGEMGAGGLGRDPRGGA